MIKGLWWKWPVMLALFVGTVVAVYAYTATNTVPTTKAGIGDAQISGFTVSAVHYGLNGTDPTKIDSVTFTLDTAPVAGSTLKIKLVSSGTDWYTCTFVGANATCNTTSPQATVLAANQLDVVVAN